MTTQDQLNALKELDNLLRKHDWSYMYSDDARAFQAGADSIESIQELIKRIDSPIAIIMQFSHFFCKAPLQDFEINKNQVRVLKNALDQLEVNLNAKSTSTKNI